MRIFITGINTQLGYHLTQTLRQDHTKLQNYSQISGTLSDNDPYMLHDSIQKTFDIVPEIEGSNSKTCGIGGCIDCGCQVLGVQRGRVHIEKQAIALKHYPTDKPTRVIGISNFTTWSNTRATQYLLPPTDKQSLLQSSLTPTHWQPSFLYPQNFPTRIPHPMFVYNHLLQEQIMQLSHVNSNIHATVICTGVIYGRSGCDLRAEIEAAVGDGESLLLGLRNAKLVKEDGVVPVVHVDRVLQEVQGLVYGNGNGDMEMKENLNKKGETATYKVLCEGQSRSVVEMVAVMNQVCGNMRQLNQANQLNQLNQANQLNQLNQANQLNQLNQANQLNQVDQNTTNPKTHPQTKPQKPTQKHSTLPLTTTQQPHNLSSQNSTRLPLPSLPQTNDLPPCLQTNTPSIFIPQLAFSENRRLFAMVMSLRFLGGERKKEEKIGVSEITEKDSGLEEGGQADVNSNKEDHKGDNQKQVYRKWIQSIINEFLQYYQPCFTHLIITQQLLHQLSLAPQPNSHHAHPHLHHAHTLLTHHYHLITHHTLTSQTHLLIQTGQIPPQRLATAQQDKKKGSKNANNTQGQQPHHKKEPYEVCFPEVLREVLKKRVKSHFVICLKSELVGRVLATIGSEEGVEEFRGMGFVHVVGKDSKHERPNTPSQLQYPASGWKTVEVLTKEFFQLFGIGSGEKQQESRKQEEKVEFNDNGAKINSQKTRKLIQGQKEENSNEQQSQPTKINLVSQYLLDNLIVYLAEAKQQLKLKGKLQMGQKFEGKENIKLFIEELKDIKRRELLLAANQEEEEER